MDHIYMTFRNDDVRESLDESLIQLTNLFIKHKIPITHAVEPANITPKVTEWLLDMKNKNPDLIEIIQHGYKHKLNYQKRVNGKIKKGEFGGTRSYESQYEDILAGKELMDSYFNDLWFPAFTFPFGARNYATIKVINDLGYKVVNGGVGAGIKYRIFYSIGRFLKREMLLNRKVSYNLKHKPGLNLFQIDFALSLIKKYNNEEADCEFMSFEELILQTQNSMKLPNIGVIFHHRYHVTEASLKLVDDYLQWTKSLHYVKFTTQKELFELYA